MNVLLCLLSAQHVPNLLSVHHYRPDRLVLVETGEMKRKQGAAHFLQALALGGLDYSHRYEIAPLESEDSLAAVRRTLQSAYNAHPEANWTINLTGGTKPMSLAAYLFFKDRGATLIYTNVARPAEIMNVDTEDKEICPHRPSIREFLAGYGFECGKQARIAEAEKRADPWWECARQIARRAPTRSLLSLKDDERQQARERGWRLRPGELQVPDPALLQAIATTLALRQDDALGRLGPEAARFLTGGWLEVFFWGLLRRHADALGCWDVRLGLDVRRAGAPSGNDLDVAFMNGHQLAAIECKSGSQRHDREGDILYKVEAVTRQFGALRVQSLIATTADNLFDRHGAIKPEIRNRAEIYNCRILTADVIRDLAENADDVAVVREKLFQRKDSRPAG
ncbi:MAG: Card1-like endonuclease domain-containing protein [Isosphaeraceae bacterium]